MRRRLFLILTLVIAGLATMALLRWRREPGLQSPGPIHQGTSFPPVSPLDEPSPDDSFRRTRIEPDLTVLVVDEANRPIAEAEIEDALTGRVLGTTGSRGRVELYCGGIDRLGVGAHGFRDRIVPLDLEAEHGGAPEHVIQVILERLWTLSGEVHRVDGMPASEAMVVAWRGARPSLEEVSQALSGGEDLLLAECDQEGHFFLEVPGPGSYELAAGGRGFITYRPETYRAAANGDAVTVTLRPAYGLMVRFRTPSGLPCISEDLFPTRAPGVLYPENLVSVDPGHPGLVLAGIDPAWIARLNPIDHLEVMGVVDSDIPATVGPLRFQGEVPGYRTIHSELTLKGLWDGLCEEVLILQPEIDGFGTIRVLFDPDVARRIDPGSLLFGGCVLRLQGVGAPSPYEYLVRNFDESSQGVIRGIPFGSYRVYMRTWRNTYQDLDPDDPESLALHVDLGPDDAEIDLTDWRVGSVEFDVRDVNGVAVNGKLLINLGRQLGDGRRAALPYHFTGRPYRIPIFESGIYAAYVEGTWFKVANVVVDGEEQEYGFRLEDDEDRVVVIQLPKAADDDLSGR